MTLRLKSLELHGYKTFASRVVFEFPGNIAAIVGPNGSGKSNIADSLRWVLGEQSFSLLRGRKTEDMIFAGSEQRPRAGMAQATITFNNEDGWLPIDYSEVSIGRRAFRDGDNEYVLNGQRVRLKEIGELLGQSGLSERTYTIIGQGLVDTALSLRPEERRRFFEEAAGIGLYRARREESLNRLETTRRNLERVLDILSELEPRLKSLERQAQRAQEYERIKADLRLLLRDWYGYHWHTSQKELAHAQDIVRVHELKVEQARDKLAGVEIELKTLREQLNQLRAELNEWHSQSADLHNQWEKISKTLAVLDERERALSDQQAALQTDLATREEEQNARQQQAAASTEELTRLQTEQAEAQSQVEAARQQLAARQQERAGIEESLRNARRQMVQAETRQVQLKAHQAELETRLESLNKNQSNLNAQAEQTTAAFKQAEERRAAAEAQRAAAETALRQAEEALQTGQRRLAELEAERKDALDVRNALEGQRSRQRAQLDVLEQAEASFSGLNEGSRRVLEAARQGHLKGLYQALGQIMEVPANLETAIAAALGEALDGVLLETQTDPEEVLTLLEAGPKGRAVLLPVDWVRPTALEISSSDDCLGIAANLVKSSADYSPVVDLLLGQVVIVKDRAAARRMVADLPAAGRVVTLKGEVFTASGLIIAGQEARSGMVGRSRQKRELQEALESVERQFNEHQAELRRLEAQLERERADRTEREKTLKAASAQVSAANQSLQQAQLAVEQARQRGEWLRGQLKDLETQVQRAQTELQRSADEVKAAITQAESYNQQVRAAGHKLDALPLDEFQAQVVHWNTTAAVAERAARDAARRVEEYQQALSANARQQQEIRQRLSDTAEQMARLQTEKITLHTAENELDEQIQAARRKIEPAEQRLRSLETQTAAVQDNYTLCQQAVSVADRHATQSQLELSRQREALESLQRRIEDDFGLVSFEYTPTVSGPTPLPLDGMVEQLPHVEQLAPEIEESINRQRSQLRRMGAINPDALTEYRSVKERLEFLTGQVEDLRRADADLREVIAELDTLMKKEFRRTFDAVAAEFRQMFTRLFGGGSARLMMTDEDNPTETGIDIEARLPGRREQGLSLLSGGERSLTAVALIFSLLKISPTPFCVLDEVDAMLDEANVGRFCELLRELSQTTQFVVITHNRTTVQTADVIYGITMGRDSASQMISLRLDEVSDDMIRRAD